MTEPAERSGGPDDTAGTHCRFERLGLGLFVHFGVFSVPEGGEWHQAASKESAAEYARYLDRFSPKKDWAEDIAAFSSGNFPNRKSAKNAGPGLCRVRRFTIQ